MPNDDSNIHPWEMVKGTDSLCLCINCKGMNACQRGCMGAIKVIDQLIMQYNMSFDEHFTVRIEERFKRRCRCPSVGVYRK
jgi:hypothetical protein